MADPAVHQPLEPFRLRRPSRRDGGWNGLSCPHCRYVGPMAVHCFYPLFLRGYMIGLGFCAGMVPGLLLLGWRYLSSPTEVTVCGRCDFRCFERRPR